MLHQQFANLTDDDLMFAKGMTNRWLGCLCKKGWFADYRAKPGILRRDCSNFAGGLAIWIE